MTHSEPQSRTAPVWLVGGLVVSGVVLGVPYLLASYDSLEGTGVVWGWGPLVLLAVSFVLAAFGRVPLLAAAAVTTGSLIAIVIARIVVDVAGDPTSHNLWPLELVIAGVIGGVASLAGASLGMLTGRLLVRP